MSRFGARGNELWRDLDGAKAVGARKVLIMEACRAADRCEKLNRYLTGEDDWLSLYEVGEDSGYYRIVVDKALSEARQQQLALKQLLVTIGIAEAAATRAPSAPAAEGSKRDDIARARAARVARAAGTD